MAKTYEVPGSFDHESTQMVRLSDHEKVCRLAQEILNSCHHLDYHGFCGECGKDVAHHPGKHKDDCQIAELERLIQPHIT